jgi:hypothetical protein
MKMVQPPDSGYFQASVGEGGGGTAAATTQTVWQQVDGYFRAHAGKVASDLFRTDNSIKNYFYSTIRRSLRRMGKLIGSKNSTAVLRKIKPSTLTKIFAEPEQL